MTGPLSYREETRATARRRAARPAGPPSWGQWQLDALNLRLVNVTAGAVVELGELRDTRAMWQVACEAFDGRDLAALDLLHGLTALFPPTVTARPGRLSVPDIAGLVIGTCLGTRPAWHTREGLIRRMEVTYD